MRNNGAVLRMPATLPVALPEAAKALEAAWQRRKTELQGWTPSNGWLVEPQRQDVKPKP
ncbi:MAG TPA: hypothetical protein VGK56_02320 [Anaerolineales bacterium]